MNIWLLCSFQPTIPTIAHLRSSLSMGSQRGTSMNILSSKIHFFVLATLQSHFLILKISYFRSIVLLLVHLHVYWQEKPKSFKWLSGFIFSKIYLLGGKCLSSILPKQNLNSIDSNFVGNRSINYPLDHWVWQWNRLLLPPHFASLTYILEHQIYKTTDA